MSFGWHLLGHVAHCFAQLGEVAWVCSCESWHASQPGERKRDSKLDGILLELVIFSRKSTAAFRWEYRDLHVNVTMFLSNSIA